MTRYFATEVGLLTREEFHDIYERWPSCGKCGEPDVPEGNVGDDGLCGECVPVPEEKKAWCPMDAIEKALSPAAFRGGGE